MNALVSPSLPPMARSLPRGPLVALGLWALVALALSFTRLVTPERPFLVPLCILGGTVAVLLSWRRLPAARAFFDGLPLGAHLGLHILRAFIGTGFLVLLSRGLLPAEFAVRAGVGDIIAGVLAALVLLIPARSSWQRRALWTFNVIGLVDILLVVATAQRILFLGDASSMEAFTLAPWPMVPLLVVPLVISSHVLLFDRLIRAPAKT
jgi:hypothetical protein